MLLEYLKVFLGWPPLAVGAATTALVILRKQVREFANRLIEAKFGAVSLRFSEQALKMSAAPEASTSSTPAETSAPALTGLQLTPQQIEHLERMFRSEQMATRTWEFRYINMFFAPSTQIVLDWLNANGSTSLAMYDAFLLQVMPVQEREAVLTALQQHHLVRLDPPAIVVTEKGKEYADWNERRRPAGAPPIPRDDPSSQGRPAR